ncbi:uncharacterized protein LOC123269025 [Cotesia glomerata]|uniref:Uncharacterized protein n=1 Tax=Cotesia glomerata TaxID=32391 RepID=A0AAV7I7Q3_COTGL|nr:uncharacterized protein LOC123269025 [Cotesia glomerata]KAH0546743.1 hypothetical protein KQX54_014579 [Cotesia glomerata]
MYYQMCDNCQKPLINENNLKIFRIRLGLGGGILVSGGGLLGAYALPLIGFGSASVTKRSITTWLQGPSIEAGSTFALCQTLGATGLYSILFKSTGSVLGGGALGMLYKNRFNNGWCSCDQPPLMPNAPNKC